MRFIRCLIFSFLGVLAIGTRAHAELKLGSLFGDNMVLQQQMAVPVWGWDTPGAKITVRFANQTRMTSADRTGCWLLKLEKLKATATPQTLTITSAETRSFTNILIGEVWLASGQSNMEKPIGYQPGQGPCRNAEEELASARFPQIRLFRMITASSKTPLNEAGKFQGWRECNRESLNELSFSAAEYFFGREIHTNLNVPVGLVLSSIGGTRIEPWTAPEGVAKVPSLLHHEPSQAAPIYYNAMIAPLSRFAMRGALWYQGESNCDVSKDDYLTYAEKMTALVAGWREIWQQGDFPFYFVQLAPFNYYNGKNRQRVGPERLAEFWELQSRAARQIKHTGMVVTTDLVDDLDDVHPANKQGVGHRLALLARHHTYGQKNLVCSGPTFRKVEKAGSTARIQFDHADGGLLSRNGQALNWFQVAAADGKFVAAQARILGNTVEVSAAGVEHPETVRFAWNQAAQPNLINGAGLPAEAFRANTSRK